MTDLEIVADLLEELGQDEFLDHPEDSSIKIISVDAFTALYIETSGYMLDQWFLSWYGDSTKEGHTLESLLTEIRNTF